MRVVVCLSLDQQDPLQLSGARLHDPPWLTGGVRTLHELAVAAAAAGYETEVRGDFHGRVLGELCDAAGVQVRTPSDPRPASPDDVLCVPDGVRDPHFFVRVAVMESRPVYLAFAPPGLFGWSFDPDWRYEDALTVDPSSVGRTEHCRVIDALGFRVWSNASTTGGLFAESGIPARVLHEGWPGPDPDPPEKDVDVVSVGANRWAPVTRRALSGFQGSWREIPEAPNRDLMREMGRGRVLVHCARIEGHSRIGVEARLMRTCCVGLASNRFAVGFDEASGGAMAEEPEDIPGLVSRLLQDPADLTRRQDRAQESARRETGWAAYVGRVGAAVASVEAEADPRDRVWRDVASEIARARQMAAEEVARFRSRRSVRFADRLGDLLRRDPPMRD